MSCFFMIFCNDFMWNVDFLIFILVASKLIFLNQCIKIRYLSLLLHQNWCLSLLLHQNWCLLLLLHQNRCLLLLLHQNWYTCLNFYKNIMWTFLLLFHFKQLLREVNYWIELITSHYYFFWCIVLFLPASLVRLLSIVCRSTFMYVLKYVICPIFWKFYNYILFCPIFPFI